MAVSLLQLVNCLLFIYKLKTLFQRNNRWWQSFCLFLIETQFNYILNKSLGEIINYAYFEKKLYYWKTLWDLDWAELVLLPRFENCFHCSFYDGLLKFFPCCCGVTSEKMLKKCGFDFLVRYCLSSENMIAQNYCNFKLIVQVACCTIT